MARSRNIKPGFFTNDELAEVQPLGRLLFAGLWCHADREGRLLDRPKKLKAEILPYDNCDVDSLLDELAGRKFIERYEVENVKYIQIVNFVLHQNPHVKEAESIYPENNKKNTSTVQAPYKHSASTVQEQEKHNTSRADSLNLIPDSLNLIPDPDPCSDSLRSSVVDKKSKTHAEKIPSDDVKLVFEHWKSVMRHPNAALDDKRRRHIKAALKMGYSVEKLCSAIDGCSKTPHNIGMNEQGQRYDGLHIIMRNADQIDRFIHNSHDPPKIKNKGDFALQANIQAGQSWLDKKMQQAQADNVRTYENEK